VARVSLVELTLDVIRKVYNDWLMSVLRVVLHSAAGGAHSNRCLGQDPLTFEGHSPRSCTETAVFCFKSRGGLAVIIYRWPPPSQPIRPCITPNKLSYLGQAVASLVVRIPPIAYMVLCLPLDAALGLSKP